MTHTVLWSTMQYDGREQQWESPCECPIGTDHDEQEMVEAGYDLGQFDPPLPEPVDPETDL